MICRQNRQHVNAAVELYRAGLFVVDSKTYTTDGGDAFVNCQQA